MPEPEPEEEHYEEQEEEERPPPRKVIQKKSIPPPKTFRRKVKVPHNEITEDDYFQILILKCYDKDYMSKHEND